MIKCPKCGYENSDGAVYCMSCAQKLDAEPSTFSSPPDTPQKSPGSVSFQTVGFGTRLGAYFIDGIVLMFFTIALVLFSLILGEILRLIITVLLLLVAPVYYIGMWKYCGGATLGKKLLGIKIVRTDNSPLTIGRAILRYAGYFVSSLIFNLGYFWVIWDGQNQGWHDKMADTLVVRIPGFKPAHSIAARVILAFFILSFLSIGVLGFMFASHLSKPALKRGFKSIFISNPITTRKDKTKASFKMPSFLRKNSQPKISRYKSNQKGKINGILYSQKDSSVMIDSKIYYNGDYVYGGEIMDISPDKITIRFMGGKKTYGVGSVIK